MQYLIAHLLEDTESNSNARSFVESVGQYLNIDQRYRLPTYHGLGPHVALRGPFEVPNEQAVQKRKELAHKIASFAYDAEIPLELFKIGVNGVVYCAARPRTENDGVHDPKEVERHFHLYLATVDQTVHDVLGIPLPPQDTKEVTLRAPAAVVSAEAQTAFVKAWAERTRFEPVPFMWDSINLLSRPASEVQWSLIASAKLTSE